mmetsp:Transcript_53244/g.154980  ORF Transcript_53244/g.154980 Transcript_53244/m.154980 type:complete len:302 (+) Transcript_53244:1444-2349(+)
MPLSQLVPCNRHRALRLPAAAHLQHRGLPHRRGPLRSGRERYRPRHWPQRLEQRLPRRDRARGGPALQRPLPPREHALREVVRDPCGPRAQRVLRTFCNASLRRQAGLHRGDPPHGQRAALCDDQRAPDQLRGGLGDLGGHAGVPQGGHFGLSHQGGGGGLPKAGMAAAAHEPHLAHLGRVEFCEALQGFPHLGVFGVGRVLPAGGHGEEARDARSGLERPRESEPRLFAGRFHRVPGRPAAFRRRAGAAAAGPAARDHDTKQHELASGLASGDEADANLGGARGHGGPGAEVAEQVHRLD